MNNPHTYYNVKVNEVQVVKNVYRDFCIGYYQGKVAILLSWEDCRTWKQCKHVTVKLVKEGLTIEDVIKIGLEENVLKRLDNDQFKIKRFEPKEFDAFYGRILACLQK